MILAIPDYCSLADDDRRFQCFGAIHSRGVAVVEGCLFIGGAGRGTPPAGSTTPRLVMQSEASPLSAAEAESVTLAVRRQVEACVTAELEMTGRAAELVEVRYCFDQHSGLHVAIELHGPDPSVIRRRYR